MNMHLIALGCNFPWNYWDWLSFHSREDCIGRHQDWIC